MKLIAGITPTVTKRKSGGRQNKSEKDGGNAHKTMQTVKLEENQSFTLPMQHNNYNDVQELLQSSSPLSNSTAGASKRIRKNFLVKTAA